MKYFISLLVILSLQGCKDAIRDTRTVADIVHEIEQAEIKIEQEINELVSDEEPSGCEGAVEAVEEEPCG